MKKKQYDLNFKKMVVTKGKEIGNKTAVARQHELDPKMVLRWARDLNRKESGSVRREQCKAIQVYSYRRRLCTIRERE